MSEGSGKVGKNKPWFVHLISKFMSPKLKLIPKVIFPSHQNGCFPILASGLAQKGLLASLFIAYFPTLKIIFTILIRFRIVNYKLDMNILSHISQNVIGLVLACSGAWGAFSQILCHLAFKSRHWLNTNIVYRWFWRAKIDQITFFPGRDHRLWFEQF